RDVREAEHGKHRHDEQRAEHHQQRSVAIAIDKQAEDRHADQRKKRLHAHQQRCGLWSDVPRLNQEFLSKRLEREYAAVKRDAQRCNQPERSIETKDFAERDLRASCGMSQSESALTAVIEHPVERSAEQTEPAEADTEKKRPAPISVRTSRPCRGSLSTQRSQPRRRPSEAERQAKPIVPEPSGHADVCGQCQRFAARANE